MRTILEPICETMCRNGILVDLILIASVTACGGHPMRHETCVGSSATGYARASRFRLGLIRQYTCDLLKVVD